MDLAALYTSHASEELVNIREVLRQWSKRLGTEEVKRHLFELAESHRAVQPNTWQFAMYAALWKNEWYCNGGFDFRVPVQEG
jgi:hypothetical protein